MNGRCSGSGALHTKHETELGLQAHSRLDVLLLFDLVRLKSRDMTFRKRLITAISEIACHTGYALGFGKFTGGIQFGDFSLNLFADFLRLFLKGLKQYLTAGKADIEADLSQLIFASNAGFVCIYLVSQ